MLNIHSYDNPDNPDNLDIHSYDNLQVESEIDGYHIAFTAATGAVADNHDILQVTTRYLEEDDITDDALLEHLEEYSHHHRYLSLSFAPSVSYLSILALLAANLYQLFHLFNNRGVDGVVISRQLNRLVYPLLGKSY